MYQQCPNMGRFLRCQCGTNVNNIAGRVVSVFSQSKLHRLDRLKEAEPVVQSCGIHCTAIGQWLLWQRRSRFFDRPGLGAWGFSVLKSTTIRERLQLQFRIEIFNLLNGANFNTPNLILFTPLAATNPTGLSGTAGAITSTSTTARQIQVGLKLLW
jgi:hypothetical protein